MKKRGYSTKKRNSNVKNRKYKTMLYAIVLLLFFVSVNYLFSSVTVKKDVTIEHGSIDNVVNGLKKQGYSIGILDKYLIALIGHPRSGIIHFQDNTTISRINFLYTIATQKPDAKDIELTLIPGETLEIFFDEIAKKYDFSKDELWAAYSRYSPYKEAGIAPDTYYINSGMSEDEILKTIIEQSEKKYQEMSKRYFGKYDKQKWSKVLEKASIIQKEAANIDEMPLISSVIDNRIAKNIKLQMDGSLNYGAYSHTPVTPQRIQNDNSTFNTYKNYGLPTIPVCSVSKEAIDAAIHPAKSNYLYFVKNKKGTHTFSVNFEDHREAIIKSR